MRVHRDAGLGCGAMLCLLDMAEWRTCLSGRVGVLRM